MEMVYQNQRHFQLNIARELTLSLFAEEDSIGADTAPSAAVHDSH